MATGEAPVLEALLEINATALNRAELDPVTMLLVRIAALAAVDAPATSYLMHVGPAVQAGVKFEQVQDVLVTIAPIVGAPRVLSAAQNITDALGIVIAINAADAEAGKARFAGLTPAATGRTIRSRFSEADSYRSRVCRASVTAREPAGAPTRSCRSRSGCPPRSADRGDQEQALIAVAGRAERQRDKQPARVVVAYRDGQAERIEPDVEPTRRPGVRDGVPHSSLATSTASSRTASTPQSRAASCTNWRARRGDDESSPRSRYRVTAGGRRSSSRRAAASSGASGTVSSTLSDASDSASSCRPRTAPQPRRGPTASRRQCRGKHVHRRGPAQPQLRHIDQNAPGVEQRLGQRGGRRLGRFP